MTDTTTTDAPTEEVVQHATTVIPHPETGEAIEVLATTPTDVLADVRDRLLAAERESGAWKRAIDRELVRRADFEGRPSVEVDGEAGAFKISVPAAHKTVWDAPRAYRSLRALVRAGLIAKDRAQACVVREVTFKAKHGELSKLLNHADQRVRDAVAACYSKESVDDRRVTVTRKVGSSS